MLKDTIENLINCVFVWKLHSKSESDSQVIESVTTEEKELCKKYSMVHCVRQKILPGYNMWKSSNYLPGKDI